MKRKIIGLGKYSAVISLPHEILKKFGWRKGQLLDISAIGRSLKIRDARSH